MSDAPGIMTTTTFATGSGRIGRSTSPSIPCLGRRNWRGTFGAGIRRYFGVPTCCLRGGGLTEPAHAGVELHGFLSYLVKVNLQGTTYRVFGYKGKQVRDNIHSADVARFAEEFIAAPREPG
jgi:hypothetical protein